MKQKYIQLFSILLVSALFTACSDNNTDDTHAGLNISLDLPDNQISDKGGAFTLRINTIGKWTTTIKEPWCKLHKNEGTGSSSVVGVIAGNNADKRMATITIMSNGETQNLTLIQSGRNGESPDPNPDPDPEPDPDPDRPSGYAGRIEIPKLKGGTLNLFHTFTAANQNNKNVITYSYEYDCSKKHTRWVAFTFDNFTCQSKVKRSDAWQEDLNIPTQYRTSKSDYSGYTRGHLVSSGDRVYSLAANKQTFYYSNMSPQQSAGFNTGGGVWNNIEDKVQAWGKITNSSDTVYVVKGGTIDGDSNIREWTSSGVAVPKYYFMTILSYKNKQYKGMAFYVEHKANSTKDIAQFALSIDQLEQKTGINFFHNLPDNIETTVEQNYNRSDWGL